ncbi:hypothetical protein [Actinomadura macrotermitis]|uniref:Uncharacterized protein n=1 Tax=Actinomadura macrotermitis TaxID=2585200 RepID=A0A7K0C258_9ACTN|nr:hypothetical protein [Actinomadura macrotermitis]MQY07182.1 hypothetical protein [Actinomadura macrotermitis]
MPTHEWTLAQDPHGPGGRQRHRKALLIAVIVAGAVGLLYLLVPALTGKDTPRLGHRTYNAQVSCQVETTGGVGTVTIDGTIKGDSNRFQVTVEVLDAATKQRIGERTFDVRDTTTFSGTTPAQTPPGPAGIDCRITKVV